MESTPTKRVRPRSPTRDARRPLEVTTRAGVAAAFPTSELTTVAPGLAARLESVGVRTIDARPGVTLGRASALRADADDPGVPRLQEGIVTLGELLAEGGMGEIWSARQLRLRREVAVKRPSRDAEEGTRAALMREARIAATLEHPNILPIHTLAREGDTPLIVMKRVHGRVFAELLDELDADRDEARFVEPLTVLLEVARALHFAHSRGVVHLDVKPDNIMVGEHGEVLLLDWGVAAAFDPERAPTGIPRTADIAAIVGTLEYLSPEQARASGAEFGPATDVYLLGAVLHEILVGAPPHRGDDDSSPALALVRAYRSLPPSYPADVPDELAAIARRALACDPGERFPDAETFRRAIAAYLEHRPALELVARADAMRAEIDYDRGTMPGRSSLQALSEVASTEAAFDACRFAYQQALRAYPDCEPARAGLAALAMLRFERAERTLDLDSARTARDDHPAPPPELDERIERLARAVALDAEQVRRLRALSADEDVMRDRAVRIRLAITGGTSWSLWNLTVGWLDRSGSVPISNAMLLGQIGVAIAVVLVVLASVGRRAVTSTAVNRRALTIVFAAFAQTLVVWLGATVLGIEPHRTAVLAFGGYVLAGLAVAAVLDVRTSWGVVAMLPFAFGAALHPEYVFHFTACLGPIGGAGLAYLWLRPHLGGEEAGA